jgi:hypothetical protein
LEDFFIILKNRLSKIALCRGQNQKNGDISAPDGRKSKPSLSPESTSKNTSKKIGQKKIFTYAHAKIPDIRFLTRVGIYTRISTTDEIKFKAMAI